jgi:2-amino-4-hydroxy-6-hydroxymethyldihydropteridine diphosphokinase
LSISPDPICATATLGLGGNLGDPVHAMATALRQFDAAADCRVEAVSRLYRTPPWGKTDQSFFYNACAAIVTRLSPEALLAFCLAVERDMKRVRLERWGPRTLDIDVLTFNDLRQETPALTLPHPRMTERGFVLMPLADFAPEMEINGRMVGEWLSEADIAGIEVVEENRGWWKEA